MIDGAPDGDAILELEGVVRSFGGIHAVDHASFSVARGSITALIGPNGAGKTTLFHTVTGFYRPQAGSVLFDGEECAGRSPDALARAGMVRTFQLTRVFARMKAIDSVMLAAPRQPGERLLGGLLHPRASRRREAQIAEEARELLDSFGLARVADEYAGTLSGGQRKLLELVRALMARPRLLMLDEPMAGINRTLGTRLFEHIAALRRDRGMTFLYVEHDMDVVMGHSDRVIVMAEGRVIAEGAPQQIQRDPLVVDAYLGGPAAVGQ